MTTKQSVNPRVAQPASQVHRACVAVELLGSPGVWKERSPRKSSTSQGTLGLRTARAPPRGLLEVSWPHMMMKSDARRFKMRVASDADDASCNARDPGVYQIRASRSPFKVGCNLDGQTKRGQALWRRLGL